MRATRRFWGLATTTVLFAILAVVLQAPLYLGVTVLLSAWVIAAQLAFRSDLQTTTNALTVELTATPNRLLETQHVQVTAATSVDVTPKGNYRLTLDPPLAMDAKQATIDITAAGSPTARMAGSFDVPGSFSIPAPTLTASDSFGLFTESLPVGTETTITVEPSAPRDAVVLSEGDRIGVGYGDHDAEQGSSGFAAGELRKYIAGDPTNRIDWKATARLGEPYIRETDPETDRETTLFLDHREPMNAGPGGRTQLDYLREVALWLVDHAASFGDPLGISTIGDQGTTTNRLATTGQSHYKHVKQHLHDLTPTTPDEKQTTYTVSSTPEITPTSTFEETLHPFFSNREAYIHRVESQPMFTAVRTRLARRNRSPWLVLFTDDTNRAELIETVKFARRQNAPTTVFLSASTLFNDGGLSDLKAAYLDYQDFREFQSTLKEYGATVYEVGPSNRIDAILAAHSQETRRSTS